MDPRAALVSNRSFAIQRSRVPLIRALQSLGLATDVITADAAGFADQWARLDVQGLEVGIRRDSSSPWADLRSVRDLRRSMRERRYQLVHLFNAKPVILGSVAARTLGSDAPAVVSTITGLGESVDAPGLAGRVANQGYRVAGSIAFRTVFQNRDDMDLFLGRGWLPSDRAVLVPGSGVDTRAFRPDSERAEAPLRVLMVARLLHSKGVEDYCRAVERLRGQRAGVEWVLAGEIDEEHADGIPRREIERLCARSGVAFVGYLNDLESRLAHYHVLVNPTRYREGVPRVVLEAASAGLAVVGTDVAGVRDVIHHERTGLLVPKGDDKRLAAAIDRLLVDHALRRRLTLAARRHVEEVFSVERVVEQYTSLYRLALGV